MATELAVAFDSYRIANRLAGRALFRLQIVSAEALTTLPSLGGIEVAVLPMDAIPDLPDPFTVTGDPKMAKNLLVPVTLAPWSAMA